MRTTRLPTSDEIRQVTNFLPVLYAEGFEPEMAFRGAISSPDYDPTVYAFFSLLNQECWSDYGYLGKDPGYMLDRPERAPWGLIVRTPSIGGAENGA